MTKHDCLLQFQDEACFNIKADLKEVALCSELWNIWWWENRWNHESMKKPRKKLAKARINIWELLQASLQLFAFTDLNSQDSITLIQTMNFY